MNFDLENWTQRPRPSNTKMTGRYIDILPFDAEKHGAELWAAFGETNTNDLLFHFGWPEMSDSRDLNEILRGFNQSGEFVTCIFADKTTGAALGMASYMAIVPEHGVVETGAVAHGKTLQKSRGATEAHYLMAKRVFDELGYRRYEWKLNNANQQSHKAAKRLGFTFEGIFRQHQVKTYGNRDTAWYSMLDSEWPNRKAAFEAWLDPANFDRDGAQIRSLEEIRSHINVGTT